MCGLVGTGYLGKNTKTGDEKKARDVMSQFIMTELLVESISRGEHATGIGLISADQGYAFIKAGWDAHKLLTYENPDCDLTRLVSWWNNHDVTFAMGHDRKRTVGPEWDNHNNHPIHRENILMVHNGTIVNQTDVFKEIKDKVAPPKGVVDSEAIASWLEANHNDSEFTKESIQDMAKKMDGAFTIFAMNRLFPKQLLITRTGRTLSLCYHPKHNFLIAISEEKFLKPVFKSWNRHIVREGGIYLKLEESDFEIVSIGEDTAMIFNLDETPTGTFKKYIEDRMFAIHPLKTSASSAAWTENKHTGSQNSYSKSSTPNTSSVGVTNYSGPSKYASDKNNQVGCVIRNAVKLERESTPEVAKMTDKVDTKKFESTASSDTVASVEAQVEYVGDTGWDLHLEKMSDTVVDDLGDDGIASIADDVSVNFAELTANLSADKHQIDELVREAVTAGVREGVKKGVDKEYTRWADLKDTYLKEFERISGLLKKFEGTTNTAADSSELGEILKTTKKMVLGLIKAGQSGEVPRDKILDYLVLAHGLKEDVVKKIFTGKELESYKVED